MAIDPHATDTRAATASYWKRLLERGGVSLVIRMAQRHAARGYEGQIPVYRPDSPTTHTYPTMEYTVDWHA